LTGFMGSKKSCLAANKLQCRKKINAKVSLGVKYKIKSM